jgi:hypothetical protein
MYHNTIASYTMHPVFSCQYLIHFESRSDLNIVFLQVTLKARDYFTGAVCGWKYALTPFNYGSHTPVLEEFDQVVIKKSRKAVAQEFTVRTIMTEEGFHCLHVGYIASALACDPELASEALHFFE